MRKLFLLTFVVFLFSGCLNGGKLPDGILPKERMQAVLWDVIRANAYTNAYIVNDSTKNPALENARLQIQIFELHKTTKDQFYKSYIYYTSHIEVMHPLIIALTLKAQNEKISMPQSPIDTFRIRNKFNGKEIQ